MKKRLAAIRDTLIAGLVFLCPLLVVLVVISKVLRLLESFTVKLAGLFGMKHVMGVPPHTVLGLLLLLLVCLLCGVLVRITFFKQFSEWMDHKLRRLIPGYELYHNLILSRLQKQEDVLSCGFPAWLHNEDGLQPGFIMEELSDGRMIVFLPTAGNVKEGNIFVVDGARVRLCNNHDARAFRIAVGNLGAGLGTFSPPKEPAGSG